MKAITLVGGLYQAIVDDDDFEMMASIKWYAHIVKSSKTTYAKSTSMGMTVYMHRLVMNVCAKEQIIDHIDGNGLNNTKGNLRITDRAGNMLRWVKERYASEPRTIDGHSVPRGVQRVVSRGKVYYYWQPGKGTPSASARIRLPGSPGDAAFWDALRLAQERA